MQPKILTADELNKIGQQTGYAGSSFSSVGLPSTITSSSLTPETPIKLPDQTPLPQAENLANYSMADIQAEPTTPTPAETTRQSYLDRITSLFKTTQEKSADQQAMEAQKGIPENLKLLTDATNRFRTTTAEQNQLIQEQGVIPLRNENAAIGVTGAFGLKAANARDLRDNAVKQYTVTSRGLFQQAEIANLRDDIQGARDAIDKAISYKIQRNVIAGSEKNSSCFCFN